MHWTRRIRILERDVECRSIEKGRVPAAAAEVPSPCAHPSTLPLPQLAAGCGSKGMRTEEQKPLWKRQRGEKKGMKKSNCCFQVNSLSFCSQKMIFTSLHYQRFEIKAEASTWAVLKVSTVISLALKILAYEIGTIFGVREYCKAILVLKCWWLTFLLMACVSHSSELPILWWRGFIWILVTSSFSA